MKKIIFGTLILTAITLSSAMTLAISQEKPLPNQIFLHTGSPLILTEDKIAPLDPNNLDVAATVVNSRTLLPLRSLAEYFGAVVSYDAEGSKAIIDMEGKRYIFPINEKKYIAIEGKVQKEFLMDTKSMIINDRTMVPLRVICENILERKVSYYDRVIAISEEEINLQNNMDLVKDVKSKIGVALKVRTMKELSHALINNKNIKYYSGITENRATQDIATSQESSPLETTSSDKGYSTTNTQVEGIDEADIVKTDGKYIYIAGNNVVRIVGANQGQLSDDAAIRLAQNKYVQEIYTDDNRLVLMGNRWEQGRYPIDGIMPFVDTSENMKIMPNYFPTKSFAFVDVYDITNPERPIFLKGHEMEGSYQSSRKNGEIVYLITNTYLNGDIILPQMKDTVLSNEAASVKLDDIMIMPGYIAPGYVVVSAMDINNNEKTEVEAIAASGYITYMNDSALYLAANDYNDATTITKFQIDGTKVGYAGSGKVKGYLLNQFSMDESEGYLRVATTTWENGNGLYVLDKSLNVHGSVTGLAKGEQIYSVRFMGDKGYVVTFRNMDPLFVFDLSDPANPKVTGELKIPGFSNYLHPIGENLILGIGAETHEIYQKDEKGNEIVVGNRQGGIKFSLFDVSDMGKPKEISKYVIGTSGSYTEAFYNHKAVMFDSENKNIAFDASISSDEKGITIKQGAIVMSYDQNKFTLKGILDSAPTAVQGKYSPYGRRVIYIGDELYYIQDGQVVSYNYDKLTPIDSIILQ